MTGRKLWYLVALAAFALLPLAGCSGGSGSPVKVGEKGTEITVNGTVEAPKSTDKTTALTAIAANTVEVYDAQDGAKLGGATIDGGGKFSGLAFTLPTTKTILVFKATVAQGTFLSLVPIDLSNPPAAGTISGSNPISIVISQESTARAQLVSQLLGISGDLGDAGKTLASVGKTYADAAQLIVDNGGQVLGYVGGGLALTGKLNNASLLPALNASTLTADDLNNIELVGSVTSVAIPGTKPIVSFQVINKATGKGVSGLKTFAFALAQLKPGQNNSPDEWLSYMVANATSRPSTESSTTFSATTSANAPTAGTSLIDNGDGSYTYVFAKDVKAPQTYMPAYDASLTHRLAIQVRTVDYIVKDSSDAVVNPASDRNTGKIYGSNFTNAANLFFDFVPASGAPVTGMLQREIVTTAACNECHTKIGVFTPHGGRVDTRFCVVCHTSQRANGRTNMASVSGVVPARDPLLSSTSSDGNYVTDGEVFGEFVTMIHKIHMGSKLTKTGYNYAGVKFNEIVYPKEVTNCRQCHKAGAGAQGDNWQAKPSRKACGSCHDSVSFATGAGHSTSNYVQADDSSCNSCHAATSTTGKMSPENAHLTNDASPNNPNVAAGLVNFKYEIDSVTVDATSNQATIKFRILKDGTPVTFTGVGTTASPLLTGFTSGPSFILAYNLSATNQPFTISADYNNLGVKAAQPISVSIANLADGAKGTLGTPDSNGYYTATITATASNFPVGAKMRAVALQGYFSQAAGTNGIAAATSRYAVSVVKPVTGDAVRRKVVEPAKCQNCHEWFHGHGGNRVWETQVCVMCHVPNLSSSGKGTNASATTFPASMSAAEQALLTADGFTLLDPTTYPEESNNFKDMIHGIHAGSSRTNPLKFVRDRSSVVMYFSAATFKFPGILKNCQMCHTSSSYTNIPADAQVTTDLTVPLNADGTVATTFDTSNNVATVSKGRTLLPNANDLVTTPFTASCVSCHDAPAAKAHMKQNGGQIKVLRSVADPGNEACVTCHGSTGPVSVNAVHR